jgi:diguanylate cyclase (GGDEF)-like protein
MKKGSIREKSKILIVDDLDANLIAMKEVLEEVDAELITANSGDKALRLMLDHDFSLVLLDVQMPIMDGFETAKLMRKNKKTRLIPIIFVTAISKEQRHVYKGYEVGAVDYMFKPIDPHILVAKVELFLKIDRQNRTDILKTVSELRVVKDKLKGKNQELSRLALHDSLTGLSNRYQFEHDLNQRLKTAKRRGDDKFAVMFLDLDNFKSINDSLGHQVGDKLLRNLAELLKNHVRKEDHIARMGGDEFAILITQIRHYEDAGKIAEKIKRSVEKPIEINNHRIYTSFSIGIACFPYASDDADEIMSKADIAMYRSKELGKNKICYFSQELQTRHSHRKMIENALRESVCDEDYHLVYQVVYDLKSRNPVGIEVLVRWTHKDLGSLNPSDFLKIAEEIGVMETISERIFEKSHHQINHWVKLGFHDLFYAVNLSLSEIKSDILHKKIEQHIHDEELCSEHVMFEVSENIFQKAINRSAPLIKKIEELGCQLILDDFGTGYSSLISLRDYPIYALKIDAGFTENLGKEKDSELIIKTILSLGKNLGFKIIAEGIESKEQLDFLVENKCSFGQGFYLSSPELAEKVTERLERHNGKR